MDEFILATKNLTAELLPTLAFIVLIMLIILLRKLMQLVEHLTSVIDLSKGSLKGVEQSIEKLQAPLDTAVHLAGTVDRMHDASVQLAKDSGEYLKKNKQAIKAKIDSVLLKTNKNKEKETNDHE